MRKPSGFAGCRRGLAALAALALSLVMTLPAVAGAAGEIAGAWRAEVLGQPVTAEFTRQGNLINGVVVIPEPDGRKNTYHMAGTYLDGEFAALHGSGHLLKGTVTGPDAADAVLTLKGGPSLTLHFTRRPPGP